VFTAFMELSIQVNKGSLVWLPKQV
jgi:hypothetical protein